MFSNFTIFEKIINSGTKCFIRQDPSAGTAAAAAESGEAVTFPFRIHANAVNLLQGHIRKRVIEVDAAAMRLLVEKENPLIKEFEQPELIKTLQETSSGCCLFHLPSKKYFFPFPFK